MRPKIISTNKASWWVFHEPSKKSHRIISSIIWGEDEKDVSKPPSYMVVTFLHIIFIYSYISYTYISRYEYVEYIYIIPPKKKIIIQATTRVMGQPHELLEFILSDSLTS